MKKIFVLCNTLNQGTPRDVIGLISGISNEREYIRAGKVIKMVVLELTDNSGKCECALFGDHVDELQRLIGNCPSGLHVVALQFAKVKIFRGKVSIQDVMNTTRIFLDPEIKETSELRKGLAIAGMSNSEKSIEQINAMNEVGVFDVCKENPIVELFELEDVGQSANKLPWRLGAHHSYSPTFVFHQICKSKDKVFQRIKKIDARGKGKLIILCIYATYHTFHTVAI
ncbi:uncharacterized protein LOC123908718 isoform X2 [Trifolium pratense]|nr:uncharacterized protein LOC123908718 isoform X2 [Trifolium pratense]